MKHNILNQEVGLKQMTGGLKHYCPEWDYDAIDETMPEIECCPCFDLEDLKKVDIKGLSKEQQEIIMEKIKYKEFFESSGFVTSEMPLDERF